MVDTLTSPVETYNKIKDQERRLRIAGCYLKREGASHSIWINPKPG